MSSGLPTDFISFKIRHNTNRYCDLTNLDAIAMQIYQASGTLGACKEYVYQTYQALTDCQISENLLSNIVRRLRKLEQTHPFITSAERNQ